MSTTTTRVTSIGADPRDGLRVLSLDGPPFAAAALSELFFLQQIAHRWAYNEDNENGRQGYDVHVSEMFDIIGGCGIGGLYAILFARLNMTIGQVIEFHNILEKKLFVADCWIRKDHESCIKAFDDALDEMLSRYSVAAELSSSLFVNGCKKCFIVVLNEAKLSSQLARSLRSYNVRTGPSPGCTIRQALHATLADLEHLPAVDIEDELFMGTSRHFSNIARLLLKELAIAFPTLHLACFVNLGADYTRPTNNSRMVGQDLMSQFRDLDCFFRLSVRDELDGESRIKTSVMGYIQEDYVSNLVDKIAEAVRGCKRVVNLLRLGNLAGEDGRNELRRDVSHIRNEEEIKRSLKKIRPQYNFPPVHEQGCLAGTREDVLLTIQNWVEDEDSATPNVFWLEGYPGTGKTAISITLKQRLAEARRLGASCFFHREDASQHSLSTFFRSIVSQLANNHHAIRDRVCHAVNSGSVTLESAPSTMFEKLVCDPLIAACEGFSEPIVLVLDALDEYGRSEEDRMRLIKLLLPRWIQLPRRYKLFIASRSQGDLPLHLDLPAHMVRRLEVGNATSSETRSDIRRFFEHNFEEIWTTRGYGHSPASVTSSELDELVDASAGLFIWASTVVEMARLMRKNARQILRDLRDRGTTIGETKMDALYQLYSTVLQPLLVDGGSIINFLSAVICARTPLPATTLSPFCKLDVDVIEDIARQLGPVMDTVDGLRFVHKSFVDYVLSQHCPVLLSINSAEYMLAASCFELMGDQLHFDMGKMESSYMLNSDIPELYEALSKELQYASRFWGVHLTDFREWDNGKLTKLAQSIDHFLNHHFLYWVEAVSIIGCFREAMEGLSILKAARFGKAINDFAQDALAFVRQFVRPISQSYPHIYVSAIPWTPSTSLIRERYLDMVPHALRVLHSGDEDWPAQLAVMRGHTNSVLSVAFSPDSSQIVSGSSDTTVRIWDAVTRLPVGQPLRGHTSSVQSVAFSPNGSQIVSGSYDNTIRIWDAVTRLPIGEPLRGHTKSVQSVAFSPDGSQIVSGSYDSTVRIWDAMTHLPIGEPLRGHIYSVLCVAFSPDGSQIVSGSGRIVRIWDAVTRLPIGQALRGHTSPVWSVTFSSDGSQIVSGSEDKTVRIWDVMTRLPIGEPLRGHTDSVHSVAFSPNASQIISGSYDNTVRIWDAVTCLPIGPALRGHTNSVQSATFSPDGSQIISGSSDNTVRIWDAVTRLPIGEPLQGHADCVQSVTFSPDGFQIISGSYDNTVRVWDAVTHLAIGEPLRGHTYSVLCVALSPDGSQIASGSSDTTIRIWDALTRLPIGEPLRGHLSSVQSVAFSPDGSQIVSGSSDTTLRIWDAVTHLPIGEPLRGHIKSIESVAFSSDGSQIASASSATVRIWDTVTRIPIGEPLRGILNAIQSVAFSPDGSQIVIGCDAFLVWETVTPRLNRKVFRGHTERVQSIAFSPDGSQIVSGSKDTTVQIWDAVTRLPIGEPLRGHTSSVQSVTFSPDGSQIVSGSYDNTIRIWDAVTRLPIGEPIMISKPLLFPRVCDPFPLSCLLLPDGWVIDSNNCRLIWIPHHIHEWLPTPGLVDVIGSRRMVIIDASDMRTGEEWSSCCI